MFYKDAYQIYITKIRGIITYLIIIIFINEHTKYINKNTSKMILKKNARRIVSKKKDYFVINIMLLQKNLKYFIQNIDKVWKKKFDHNIDQKLKKNYFEIFDITSQG